MKVFIVENSLSLQERLTRIVSGLGGIRVVGQAATASDAVDQIRKSKPAVIILDIRLDQGTGGEVLEKVKAGSQRPIVIVLTNYPYPQYRKKYLEAGADYFFDKSTELRSVIEVLKTLRDKKSPRGAAI
jgi:DNA-binding NarL/FixJ family response regulator